MTKANASDAVSEAKELIETLQGLRQELMADTGMSEEEVNNLTIRELFVKAGIPEKELDLFITGEIDETQMEKILDQID